MTHLEIILKLIGQVQPVGETNEDKARFENLKLMCEVADGLLAEISQVSFNGSGHQEASIVRATKYANDYLSSFRPYEGT